MPCGSWRWALGRPGRAEVEGVLHGGLMEAVWISLLPSLHRLSGSSWRTQCSPSMTCPTLAAWTV